MSRFTSSEEASNPANGSDAAPQARGVIRINSRELFQQQREVEIEHEGKIYRLCMTKLNKLILTA